MEDFKCIFLLPKASASWATEINGNAKRYLSSGILDLLKPQTQHCNVFRLIMGQSVAKIKYLPTFFFLIEYAFFIRYITLRK